MWHSSTRSFVVTASALFLWSPSAALDLLVKDIKCESRPVTISFDYICSGEYLCTFGGIESMEGSFKYYGLVDQYNATANTNLVLNADMLFYISGYTHTQNMIKGMNMPVCHDSLVPSNNNVKGDCPSDGSYSFDTTYNMPQVSSEYAGWAASGWTGQIVVTMYTSTTNQLVGKCSMNFQTMVTGAYEKGAFKSVPSAKTTGAVVGSLLAASIALCVACYCRAKKRHNQEIFLDEEEPTGDYHRARKIKSYLL